MGQLTRTVLVGGGVVLAAWTAWGLYSTRTTESVPYERRQALDGIELRQYPETVLVETTAPDQRTAFRRLFRYISGTNEGDESISMTAPVETQDSVSISMTAPVRSASSGSEGDEIRMAFYLPSEYTPETAPAPTDSSVSLVTEQPRTVAVDRFSWFTPGWRVDRRTRKLCETLDANGIELRGEPYLLRYNDPWTPPFLRRNEVAVTVSAGE
jgi:hypothetical protein